MPSDLFLQHCHSISIQRNASRRAILGLVQPGCPAIQINPVPFQAGYLARTATCSQRKPHDCRQVRRASRNEPVCILPVQPSVAFHFAMQKPDLWKALDPLPLITSHPQQAANQREVTIDGCRPVPLIQFALDDLPDTISGQLIQHQRPEVRVKLAANPPYVLDAPQIRLHNEISDDGFLPGAPGFNAEVRFPERINLQSCDKGSRFRSVFSPSALAYSLAVR